MKWFLIFCFCLYGVSAKHEIYDGYVVYEVYPNNLEDISSLNEVVNELTLDIWSYPNLVKPGQIFVPGLQKETFENALKKARIQYKATIENITELLELEEQSLAAAASRQNHTSSHRAVNEIYSFNQVTTYLADIARRYPRVARLVNGGSSFQGRPIQYLEISTTAFQNPLKPVIMVQSLLHAREWVSLPPSLYAIHKLVVDVTESDVLNNIDWIIMPVANPDGYEWSRTNARFWRKNRRTGLTIGNVCMGVDLNRNFDVNWGTLSSNNPCQDTYHGRGPNSEPETEAVVKVLQKYQSRMAMYIDLHSFGSMILYGYGNGTIPQNAGLLNVAADRMAQAIDNVKWANKPNYRVGNSVAVLHYMDSGTSNDFAQSIGIPHSFCYELPGLLGATGLNGFLVDPGFINQASVETWAGIVTGARYILRR
ncbi:unnamed protein product [Arctia plantaginis]|uniref:Peptidase M14 domain-containing protein n=1 Tax=Arctia plantaginis TaxID=874455 RepID=A0A8S0YRE7_ARCPL|nr:unnamed protein product [Arctia plantaginis]